MPSLFGKSRNVELSTIQYFETAINASWNDVTVVKGFPQFTSATTLPIVAITLTSENTSFREVGSRLLDDIYSFAIDIFGKSTANRLDLSQFIKDKIFENWVYNTYVRGSGDTIVATPAGKVTVIEITENTRIEFGEDIEVYDRFRHLINFNCRVTPS